MTRLRDGDATWLRPTIPPCSRQAQSSRSRIRTEKAGTPRHPGKGRRFSRLATRCCSQPESRRRLEFFGEGEGGGEDNGFVCGRRSLVLDADRKFHVVRVRVHFHAVEDPVIQLLFDFLQFNVCHHHSPLSVSTRKRRGAWGLTRSIRYKRRREVVMRRSSPVLFDTRLPDRRNRPHENRLGFPNRPDCKRSASVSAAEGCDRENGADGGC